MPKNENFALVTSSAGTTVKHVFDERHEPLSSFIPMFVFRYQKVDERFFAGLKESYLWFSQPSELNDPLDCANLLSSDYTPKDIRRHLRKYGGCNPWEAREAAEAIASSENERHRITQELFERRIKHVNLCCFSMSPSANLLWAHYADGHRGVAVIYAAPLLLFESEKGRFSIIEVRYKHTPAKYNNIREQLRYGDSAEYNFRFDQIVLGTKTSDWSYEKELRLISPHHGKNYFKPGAFIGVICGHRMPMDTIGEVNYRVYESHPAANIFYQRLDNATGQITVPGMEPFEGQMVEITVGGWYKLDEAKPEIR
jgi:hypothetical protein